MSRYILPRHIDARKASKQCARVSGIIQISQLVRLAPSLYNSEGEVSVRTRFDVDDAGRSVLEIEATCNLELTCQRCLGKLGFDIACHSKLGLISSEGKEDYLSLPDGLEPILTGDTCDIWEAVEDELILALPPYPKHSDGECNLPVSGFSNVNCKELEQQNTIKPFGNLPKLMRDKLEEGENYGGSKK